MSALVKTPLADGRIELSGATYHIREQIKASAAAAGGKAIWDPARKVWTVPAGTVLVVPPPPAKAEKPKPSGAVGGAGGSSKKSREAACEAGGYASASSKKKSREDWTLDEWQSWIWTFKLRNHGRVESCCRHAKWVGDPYGPMEYSCARHGHTKGSYTGD